MLHHPGWGTFLSELGKKLERPKAILAISAHWMTSDLRVLNSEYPKTIHDFMGFPQELYDIRYPAPGAPEIAERVAKAVAAYRPKMDGSWGFDHGTWTPLYHLFPNADVSVVQLSLNMSLNEKGHFEIAKCLSDLRDEGILILGSGDIVHNLRKVKWRDQNPTAHPWADQFEEKILEALEKRNTDAILYHKNLFPELSKEAVPTDDHYLPLIYSYGASSANDKFEVLFKENQMGSVTLTSVMWS